LKFGLIRQKVVFCQSIRLYYRLLRLKVQHLMVASRRRRKVVGVIIRFMVGVISHRVVNRCQDRKVDAAAKGLYSCRRRTVVKARPVTLC